ncbi:MAG TPA: hypothetical protein VJG29_02145 [Candidatus Paceibacterota bacterium]
MVHISSPHTLEELEGLSTIDLSAIAAQVGMSEAELEEILTHPKDAEEMKRILRARIVALENKRRREL